MELNLLDGSLNPVNIGRVIKHNHDFYKSHPGYFRPEGLLVFCGEQGSGKTLSAVQYVKKLCSEYPDAILCTNVQISGLNPSTHVVEYDIIGTSQVYGRLAKPFREQIRNVVLCSNFCKILQINTLIDGSKSVEKDGKLITESVKRFYWFHDPALYDSYDTYAKMKRYKKEWQGRRLT